MDDLGALSDQLCRSFVLISNAQNEIPTVTIENGPADGSSITINNPAFSWSGEDTDGSIEAYNVDLIWANPYLVFYIRHVFPISPARIRNVLVLHPGHG